MEDSARNALTELAAREDRRMRIAAEIVQVDPTIGFISAIIIAGDRQSAELATRLVDSGRMTAAAAVNMVGSYARLDFAVRMYELDRLPNLFTLLPSLWRDSDPDDTDPRFLALWKEARRRKGEMVRDSVRDLPAKVTIFRGQDRGATLGIAWTTDRGIAVKYARGMALRQNTRDGVVLTAEVSRRRVLAFLTKRGESEVVVDPARVKELRTRDVNDPR